MIRPEVVAASLALALPLSAGVAHAEPTRRVLIETVPGGAHVFLNQKEDGVKCEATPCTIDVPLGETPLIVELENYAPSITMLDVPKGRGVLKQSITLIASTGGIDAKPLAGAKGATVKVDEVDKGVAPVKIPTEPGPHHITYVLNGKQVFEKYIEVEAGDDYYDLTPTAGEAPPGPPNDDPGNPLDPPGGGDVEKKAPAGPHTRILTGSVLFDVGFRQFSYENGTGSNNRPESEGGQLLAGPLIELYPTALFAPKTLPGLALLARFEFGFNNQSVTGTAQATTTYWQSIEISGRHRWVIGDNKGSVDASVGYVQDRLQFSGHTSDIALVPDANYQALRLGVRGAIMTGNVEPYLVLENRIVLSSGDLGSRYDHASTNGIHAALGFAYHHDKITAHLEGQLTRYSSTYSNDMMNTTNQADGATDVVELISLMLGYSY